MTFIGYPWDPSWGPGDFFLDTVMFWEWNRHHLWIGLPWFSALSYLTLKNGVILPKVTFAGYPWDPSWGPEDIILDTVAIWRWYSWGHWIQQPCFRPLSYPKLQFWAKGTKVVGIPTCVAQHLPIWAWALSLNMRLKAIGATDLGSKGTYGIGGLSRKKYVKFSQKACSQPVFQAKRWDGLVLGNAPQREGNGV